MKKFLILILLLSAIPLVSAQCLEVKIAKSAYLSGETLQIEVTGNLPKSLTYNDISFLNSNREYFPAFTIQQISANKWIVFGEVSDRYGVNEFSLNKIICRENGTLQEITKTIQFTVKKPVQDYFNDFSSALSWSSLSLDELSNSIDALSDYGSEAGKTELLKKGDDCWPSGNCNVISTALAIIALNETNGSKNWILDSQNSVNIGVWTLITNSMTEQQCNLTINDQSSEITVSVGTKEFPLTLPNTETINVSLICPIAAKISHTYLGEFHEFNPGIINNRKCWGKTYRSNCDALSTAQALRIVEDSDAESWLLQNAKTTEEIAYAYLYTKDSKLEEWLVNNQDASGYWSNSALAISNKSSASATAAAIVAFNGNSKAEDWLLENFNSFTIEEKAKTLQIFKEKIEPIVAIQSGFVKANSLQNATLRVSNKGNFPVILKAVLESSSLSITLPAKSTTPIVLAVPYTSETKFESIDLTYKLNNQERSYSVPVIVLPAGQDINLNESIDSETIKTAAFQFSDSILNETMSYGEERTINLSIKNSGPKITVDITLWGLSGIISTIPVTLELGANSVTNLPVTLKATDTNYYSGQLTIESNGKSVSLPVYVNIAVAVSEKSCSDLGGSLCVTECKGNLTQTKAGACCVGECKKVQEKKSSMQTIGIIMLVAAVLIAGLFLFFKLRKPKKPALERVLAKIKEESKIRDIEDKEKKV